MTTSIVGVLSQNCENQRPKKTIDDKMAVVEYPTNKQLVRLNQKVTLKE
jgi:hypothetical protein